MKKTTTPIENTATQTTINNGADSMNPPATPDFTDVAFAKEADKRNKAVKAELKKIDSSFEKIAFHIHWFFANGAYEQLGYKSIYQFASKEYKIGKTTINNFINVVERFAERDADGNVTDHIRPELSGFQSSKLIALLGIDDDKIDGFSADMSVRDIKKKVKELNADNSEADADSEDRDSSEPIDTTATEVNRQTIITFSSLAEYNAYLDGMNDLIEKNLKSKSFKDGAKKIEVSIVW